MSSLLRDIIHETSVLQSEEKERFITATNSLSLTQQEELQEIFKKNPENIKLLHDNFSEKLIHLKNREQLGMLLEEEMALLNNTNFGISGR